MILTILAIAFFVFIIWLYIRYKHNKERRAVKRHTKWVVEESNATQDKINTEKKHIEIKQDIQYWEPRIKSKYIPANIKQKIFKEIELYSSFKEGSEEKAKEKIYIDLLLDLPYNDPHKPLPKINLALAEERLNKNHFGMEKAKERVMEFLALKLKNPDAKGALIALCGPPGVGKTSFAKAIASALDKKFIKISLGGVHNEVDIRGYNRTYIGSKPGNIINSMLRVNSADPVILLDEIDKVGMNNPNGDVSAALLEVLDYEQNNKFQDHYLEEEYDLSKVFFIVTANYKERIPKELLNRIEIIDLDAYSAKEKLEIAKNYLIPEIINETNLDPEIFKFSDEFILNIINKYTSDEGIRELKRFLEKIATKYVTLELKGKLNKYTIALLLDEIVSGFKKVETDSRKQFWLSKLEKKYYPLNIKQKLLKEIELYLSYSDGSEEKVKEKKYMDLLLDLPYNDPNKPTPKLNLALAEERLNKNHFGMEEAKERVMEFLALKIKNPDAKGAVIALCGPPGVGKTSFAKAIASALDKKFIKISLGGVHHEVEIRGHNRTYIGSKPGNIINSMLQVNSADPVILLDEIDKVGMNNLNGDVSAALLEVLDYEQNNKFQDHYLEEGYDLSKVFFIVTANYKERIPNELLNRLEIIDLDAYSAKEKLKIAKEYIIPTTIKELNLDSKFFKFSDEIILRLIDEYTNDKGIRDLKRIIEKMARKITVLEVKNKLPDNFEINENFLKSL